MKRAQAIAGHIVVPATVAIGLHRVRFVTEDSLELPAPCRENMSENGSFSSSTASALAEHSVSPVPLPQGSYALWPCRGEEDLQPGEILISVDRLELDATSAAQLWQQAEKEHVLSKSSNVQESGASRTNSSVSMTVEERVAARIMAIVSMRGKMHNPVTDSGGVLVGRVVAADSSSPYLALTGASDVFDEKSKHASVGGRVVPLCSLSAIPLYLTAVRGFEGSSRSQVLVEGLAVVSSRIRIASLPDDMPDALALAAVDVSRLLPQLRALVPQLLSEKSQREQQGVVLTEPMSAARPLIAVVVGCGAAGLCAMAMLRHLVPPGQLRVVALDISESALQGARELLGLAAPNSTLLLCDSSENSNAVRQQDDSAHVVRRFNARDVRDALHILEEVLDGTGADVVLNCVSVQRTEGPSTVLCKPGGHIVYFSMATDFSRAVLSTDGCGLPCTVVCGAGVFGEAAQQSFDLLAADPALLRCFALASGAASWVPTPLAASTCALARFAVEYSSLGKPPVESLSALKSWYGRLHAWSVANPSEFWGAVWEFFGIIGDPGRAPFVNRPAGSAGLRDVQYFPQARVNLAQNLLRHRGERAAIVFRSENDVMPRRCISFDELYARVARARKHLESLGVLHGDRVGSMLPNMPEAIVYMLATTSMGGVWTAITPDSGDRIATDRLGQISPKVILVVDKYFYNGREVRPQFIPHALTKHVVVIPFGGEPVPSVDEQHCQIEFTATSMKDAIYILFTSGTTGKPKAIVQGFGVHLNHLKETSLHCEIDHRSVAFVYTNAAWMLWHWLASTLALGATVVLYDGSPAPNSDWSALWRICAEERVTYFGCGARLLESCMQSPTLQMPALPSLQVITSTGSPLSAASAEWVMRKQFHHVRLSSISGGTEINGCLALGCPLVPVHGNELQVAPLGMDTDVAEFADSRTMSDRKCKRIRSAPGELVCFNAFPSMPLFFWGDERGERYRAAYFEKWGDSVWAHGDIAERTPTGGFFVRGRSDATLNPGGVRIGTSEYYEIINAHFAGRVLDSVISDSPTQGLVLFVVVPNGKLEPSLIDELKLTIRRELSPKHVPHHVVGVAAIPYNQNFKKMEVLVNRILQGRPRAEWAAMLENLSDAHSAEDFVAWAESFS